MKDIFVPDYEWNAHYESPEEMVKEAGGELSDGDEFELVRLTVGAKTRYRIVNGQPIPVSVAFPDKVSG